MDDRNKTYTIIGLVLIIVVLWFLRKGGVTIATGLPTITVGGPIVSTYNVEPPTIEGLQPYQDKLGDIILNGSFPDYNFDNPPDITRKNDINFGPVNIPYYAGAGSEGPFNWSQTTDLFCCCTDRPIIQITNPVYEFVTIQAAPPPQHYEVPKRGGIMYG